MDADRFDALTRALFYTGSRRRAVVAVLSSGLGLLGRHATDDAAAHDFSGRCKKKSGKARKKCLKKAKRHNASHTVLPSDPTCSDGVRNGAESDIDCGGGTCRRCAFGQRCTSRNDCDTAYCSPSAVCSVCDSLDDCPADEFGACSCVDPDNRGARCLRQVDTVSNCFNCPTGTAYCIGGPAPDPFFCLKLCGAA